MLTQDQLRATIGRPMTVDEAARATPIQREWHELHEFNRLARANRLQSFGVGLTALRRMSEDPILWSDVVQKAIGEATGTLDAQQAPIFAIRCMDRVLPIYGAVYERFRREGVKLEHPDRVRQAATLARSILDGTQDEDQRREGIRLVQVAQNTIEDYWEHKGVWYHITGIYEEPEGQLDTARGVLVTLEAALEMGPPRAAERAANAALWADDCARIFGPDLPYPREPNMVAWIVAQLDDLLGSTET
jgi:hypothetical protein